MVEAGRIRAGDYSDGHPRKLDKWRLTSKDRQRLDAAAELWGGEVKEWEKRPGEFELYTETDVLPILLIPDTEASIWYEDWTRGGLQRRCDGVAETLSDGPCLCDPDARQCKPHLRFPVVLPDLRGIGSWLVQSTGWNAAGEIPQTVQMLARASAQGVLIPARLRLEQRVDVKAGQTRKFAVPVVDVDISFRELLGQTTLPAGESTPLALPAGYVPLTGNGGTGPTLEEGLHAAETQVATRTARSAAPIPAAEEIEFGNTPVPVPEETVVSGAASSTAEAAPPSGSDDPGGLSMADKVERDHAPRQDPGEPYEGPTVADISNAEVSKTDEKPATKAQKTKLDVLVGRLRDTEQKIKTEQLWAALAKERNIAVEMMIQVLEGEDSLGTLHWAPLRDSLNRVEASDLIDRLERLEAA